MLSGNPGLGKTEIIRAVINECSKYGNVLIPKDMNSDLFLIFDYAKLYSPSLICIDDIDLLFESRNVSSVRKGLGNFLNVMDGIQQNKFFLIATTNDKTLVDTAASRPGRFDEIIDFGDFERRYYMELIKQRTGNERIISLFDEEMFNLMDDNKISGAFIVNLIKQLEILTEMNPDYKKQNLLSYINSSYRGFYKSQVDKDKQLGF